MLVFFKKYKDYLFILLISLLPLVWYGGLTSKKLIISNDTGYFLNPQAQIINRFFTWDSGSGFGMARPDWAGSILYHGLEAVLTSVTGSLFLAQKIYTIMWFFLPMFAIYFALKKIPKLGGKPYFALIAAVLYQFNFYQLQGWKVLWRTRFSLYIALPIILWLMIDYFEGRRRSLKTSIAIGLTLFLFNGGGSPPIFGSVIILILAIILFYALLNLGKNIFLIFVKRTLTLILSSVIFTVLFSAYWILPYLHFIFRNYSAAVSSGGLASYLSWADVVHRNASILNLMKLQGLDFFEITAKAPYINVFLENKLLVALSFLWPLLIVLSYLLVKHKFEKKWLLLFFCLFFLSLTFSAGSHPPFKKLYAFLISYVPGYPIFRSAIQKFGSAYWFSATLIAAFSLSSLTENSKYISLWKKYNPASLTRAGAALVIIGIILWHFPLLTAGFFDWNPPLSTMETVPDYVLKFKDWPSSIKKDNQRILLTPRLDSAWHGDVYNWNYFSLQTVPSLLTTRSVVVNDTSNQGDKEKILNAYYDSFIDGTPIWQKLNKILGIKYFLHRQDVNYSLPWVKAERPELYEEKLKSQPELKQIADLDKWKIYSLSDLLYLPHFYIPDSLTFLNGDTADFINVLPVLPNTEVPAYYFAKIGFQSQTPKADFNSYFLLPGNPCCDKIDKFPKTESTVGDKKTDLAKDGIKQVFLDDKSRFKIPKKGIYALSVRAGTLFTNSGKISVDIDGRILEKELSAEERKIPWINIGQIELGPESYSLKVISDGNAINSFKAGDITLVLTEKPNDVPAIEFSKINNTKYYLKINKTTNPLTLVFSESFHPDWKLYPVNNGNIKAKLKAKQTVASYLEDKIIEKSHSQTFSDRNIFETLFLKAVPENKHFFINGYANAWQLSPGDFKNGHEMEMIIEFYPQRLFNFGLIVTFISLTGSVFYLWLSKSRSD